MKKGLMKKDGGNIFILLFFLVLPIAFAPADADLDGVPDENDRCPNSATNVVDGNGCSCLQLNCPPDNNTCTDDCSVIQGIPRCFYQPNIMNSCLGGSCNLAGECVNITQGCIDSDSGNNPNTYGSISRESLSSSDYCETDPGYVREFYCRGRTDEVGPQSPNGYENSVTAFVATPIPLYNHVVTLREITDAGMAVFYIYSTFSGDSSTHVGAQGSAIYNRAGILIWISNINRANQSVDISYTNTHYTSSVIQCENGCEGGRCAASSPLVISENVTCVFGGMESSPCSDSDGGIDYYSAGTVTACQENDSICRSYEDSCALGPAGYNLVEYACEEGGLAENYYLCLGGCNNGSCTRLPESAGCVDSDGGVDSDVGVHISGNITYTFNNEPRIAYDQCRDENTLWEYTCRNNGEYSIIVCPNGCSNGACVLNEESVCTDTDSGNDVFTRGIMRYRQVDYPDFCRIGGIDDPQNYSEEVASCTGPDCYVVEHFCSENFWAYYNCQYGCENGSCVSIIAGQEMIQTQCSSEYGGCAGYGSCTVQVTAPNNDDVYENLTWTSSCDTNRIETVLDGQNEVISFDCVNNTCGNGVCDEGDFETCPSDCPFCTDSDSGNYPFEYGIVNTADLIVGDQCGSSRYVVEQYCRNSTTEVGTNSSEGYDHFMTMRLGVQIELYERIIEITQIMANAAVFRVSNQTFQIQQGQGIETSEGVLVFVQEIAGDLVNVAFTHKFFTGSNSNCPLGCQDGQCIISDEEKFRLSSWECTEGASAEEEDVYCQSADSWYQRAREHCSSQCAAHESCGVARFDVSQRCTRNSCSSRSTDECEMDQNCQLQETPWLFIFRRYRCVEREQRCEDMDAGNNPNTASLLRYTGSPYGIVEQHDTCHDNFYLTEGVCNSQTDFSQNEINIFCENGCRNGACVANRTGFYDLRLTNYFRNTYEAYLLKDNVKYRFMITPMQNLMVATDGNENHSITLQNTANSGEFTAHSILGNLTYDVLINIPRRNMRLILIPPQNRAPIGWLDSAIGGLARGWAVDPDHAQNSMGVHIYINDTTGGRFAQDGLANSYRQDVNDALGITGSHGYVINFSEGLVAGRSYAVYAFGIDLDDHLGGANVLLSGTPKLMCYSGCLLDNACYAFTELKCIDGSAYECRADGNMHTIGQCIDTNCQERQCGVQGICYDSGHSGCMMINNANKRLTCSNGRIISSQCT